MYQSESAFEFEDEMDEFEFEYEDEGEAFEFGEIDWEGEGDDVFSEDELMELTAELMNVDSEEELDYFLGKLVKRAARAVRKVAKSPVGKALGGVLKSAAKKALPIAGGALGAWVGGPLGAKIGSGVANAAGKALGLEAEMLEPEDMEFEGAKQFVKFAGSTTKKALTAPASPNPKIAARKAAVKAAKALAPGLLPGARVVAAARRGAPRGMAGRWVRRGRDIVLLNA